MATGRTLNAANLEALGAAQLAALLIEISRGNAVAQRRLRLALAGDAGATAAARAVGQRLNSIARARTWLGWQRIKPFLTELETQHRAILDLVAPSDPREAFELLWRLVECAGPVLGRTDDGGDRLCEAFRAAARDLGPLAQRVAPRDLAGDLAGRLVRGLLADEHGVWDEMVGLLALPLGAEGLALVRDQVQAWLAGSKQSGAHLRHRGALVLRQVADAMGDVDGFAAQYDPQARRMPLIAAGIARRLLAAGRAQEALDALDAVEAKRRDGAPLEWDEARVAVLDALGRAGEAQAFRWRRFQDTLEAGHLRAHLKSLPDFEDFEAEQRAFAHALAFADVHRALAFLVAWPALQQASELVLSRTQALDGNLYEVLTPAAEALEGRYPLAATLLRRAMIGFALGASRSSRYGHAARHLLECRAAAPEIGFGGLPDHAAYERALRAAHGRRAAFWDLVDAG